jgi:peptidoglycan/LPS O-acetylase OafA/YrhL
VVIVLLPLSIFELSEAVKRYLPIDALRGIAALAVVLFHFTISGENVHSVLRFGSAGVDLFFIISGFVIYMTLDKSPTVAHFVVSRVSRLFPAYWMGVIFSFVIILWHQKSSSVPLPALENPFKTLAANLSMIQYYLGVADIEPPYWTMIVELLFYVFMGALIFSRGRKYTITISVALCCSIGIASQFVGSSYFVKSIFVALPLLYHFPLFFIGMLFYRRWLSGVNVDFYLLLVVGVICQMCIFPYTWRTCKYIGVWEYIGVLGLFVLVFECFCRERLQFIVHPVSLFLGRISFPLYLTHQYININLIVPYMRWKFEMSLFSASVFVALPSCIVLAWLFHLLAEKWMSKRLRAYLSAKWIRGS